MSREHNNGSVWSQFVKTAVEQGLITSDLTSEQEYISNRGKEVPGGDNYTRHEKTKDYDVTEGDGKKLIEKAHPEDAQMARAMGEGGLVENIIQQQEKSLEIALKMPDGSLHGVHASMVMELVKLANSLEDEGNKEAALKVDAALKKIYPFDNGHLCKEAAWGLALTALSIVGPMAWNYFKTSTPSTKSPSGYKRPGTRGSLTKGMGKIGWIVTGLGILGALLPHLTSRQEDLKTDIKDLKDNLDNLDSTAAKEVSMQLQPFVSALRSANLGSKKGFQKYLLTFKNLRRAIPRIESGMAKVMLELGNPKWYHFGLAGTSKLKEKYKDFVESYGKAETLINKITKTGKTMDSAAKISAKKESKAPISGITGLQRILFRRGYRGNTWEGQVTGKMDNETLTAVQSLEQKLSRDLKDLLTEKGKVSDFTQKIVSNGQLIIDPKILEKIISLTEKVINE